MLGKAEQEEKDQVRSSEALVQEKENELLAVKTSLNRLVSIYVAQDIDRDTFTAQKAELLSKKKQIEEVMKKNENGQIAWIEPFRKWVNTARTVDETVKHGSSVEKKGVASKVFGSNLFLDNKKARGCSIKPWSFLAENPSYLKLERVKGIEPSSQPWEGHILPLNHTRVRCCF